MNEFIKLMVIDRDGYTSHIFVPVAGCVFEESINRRNSRNKLLVDVSCQLDKWMTVHTFEEIERNVLTLNGAFAAREDG